LGIDYSLVICMAEDYRPTLDSVEAIVRLFTKHGLSQTPYPSIDECTRLRTDPCITGLIDKLRQHAARRIRYTCERCGTHEATMSVSVMMPENDFNIVCPTCQKSIGDREVAWLGKSLVGEAGEAERMAGVESLKEILAQRGINSPDAWITFNSVDWGADIFRANFPSIIDAHIFSGKLFEKMLQVYGSEKIRARLERDFSRGNDPEPIVDVELDYEYIQDVITEYFWEVFLFRFPGEGEIFTQPEIASNGITYGRRNRTRMMIRDEYFGRLEYEGIEGFIKYFSQRFSRLFKEIKEATGSELLVLNVGE
jgi:hypothetical protein